MLKQKVNVIIDRPLHSRHPEHPDIFYEVNYGYIPNILSSVDLEELDAYVLGVNEPISSYTGEVIAIIHRFQEEDKLIVSNQHFTKEEIRKKTYFMEQYFSSYIEMAYPTKEDILFDLKQAGLNPTDTLFIHSSLKSFGNLDGKILLSTLKQYFQDGLLIFPTHTWNTIKEDGDIFDAMQANSCVGMLTNLAILDSDFKRSMHPTHSVCAYGRRTDAYLALDRVSSSPVSPEGCTGSLWRYGAKILFMGVPLSKNTFIHSIEEEFQVPDRFTEKIYHFQSKGYEEELNYEMPRHYSSKRAHLSENYAKLKPHLIAYGIAKDVYIGNSLTTIVDARECRTYVKYLLNNNIHIFDDDKEFTDHYENYQKTKQ